MWRLCYVSTWLEWTTTSRIPYPVGSWLGRATREILVWDLVGRSKAAAILELTHSCLVEETHFIGVGQQTGYTRWGFSSMMKYNIFSCRIPTPWKSEAVRNGMALDHPCGFQLMLVGPSLSLLFPLLWVELCAPQERYVKVLILNTSDRDLIWKRGLCRDKLKGSHGKP